ncbi:M50 family metallopeptidase [Paenibacillus soyae]|uniref:M50 family metallopeptidase n=1 Tax=Paenibacillus soyae TaxID=2969249 RepID=A0A9X2S7Q3_9BACL|nr:M50 family metallopeptidase [Paenibacillus soyae]MCR2803360.1 M50 family metallopeptidase [Paenibacillus soyae]
MFSWFRTGVIFLIVLFLTRFVPFSAFFRNVNTLVHELSHAAAALLLQGKVMEIHLYADQSGVTLTRFSEGWMLIPIGLAGYAGASLFAALLFDLYRRERLRTGLSFIVIMAVLALVLFVRNGYGIAWCAGFSVVTALIAFLAPRWLQKGYYLLIAFLCLVESVVSAFVILYLSFTSPAQAGDAASLSQTTMLPAAVWGLMFAIFSVWCARIALSRLLGGRRRREVQAGLE